MKKNLLKILFGGAILGGMASCATQKTETPAQIASLNGEWEIVKVGDRTISTEGMDAPYIGFNTESGQMNGSTGCNRMFGQFNKDAAPGVMEIGGMGATRMMCPDMEQESAILDALSAAKSFGFNKDSLLILNNVEGKAVMELKKRVIPSAAETLAGEWKIMEVKERDLADAEEQYSMTFTPADSSFVAETGCNNIGGKFAADYQSVVFSNLMQTRMMCPDTSVEEAVAAVLPTIKSFGVLASGNIGFYDGDGEMVMVIGK